MVRESLRTAALPLVLLGAGVCSGGCSFILDFENSEIPIDAEIDSAFLQDECDYKEPNNSMLEAALFMVGDAGPVAICPVEGGEDHDFFKFTVPAMTASLSVKIMFTNTTTGDLDLRLFDPTGTMISQSRGFGNEEAILCPAISPACPDPSTMPGDYVFEVFPAKLGDVNHYTPMLTITPM